MIKLYPLCRRSAAVVAVAAMAAASLSAENADFTQFIKNNSFESNFNFWTQSEMKVQNNSTFPLKDGNNYVEKWVPAENGADKCSVSQTLTGLIPGKYTLTAAAQNHREGNGENQTGVWIFAGEAQTAVGAINDYSVSFEVGADGNITIGYKAEGATGNYLAVDNFRLVLNEYNAAQLTAYVDNVCTRANELSKQKMTASIAAELTAGAANVRTVSAGGDPAAIAAAVLALNEVSTRAEASILTYEKFNEAIASLEAAYETIKARPDAVDTKALIDSARSLYNEATATDEEVRAEIAELNKAEAAAKDIVKAFEELATAITKVEAEYETIKDKPNTDSVKATIDEARTMHSEGKATAAEAREMVDRLGCVVLLYNISQSSAPAPTVVTGSYVARGANFALGRSTVTLPTGAKKLEYGFCWSTEPNPTIADKRSTKVHKNNGDIYHMEGLKPSTVYYVRAYAITKDYGIGYGDVVKIITIPMGTMTWSYNANGGDEETNNRIKSATENAVNIWNTCMNTNGFHATVNYSPGTPTADCSYGGWIRMGASASYQRTGTVMHEMNHGVGVGQLNQWFGEGDNNPYRDNSPWGFWKGKHATDVVSFFENNPTARVKGDKMHMWPYGINGAHEDNGTEILYLANGLITGALGEDGLPPVAGQFLNPCYYFPSEEGVKYYLKVEDTANKTYSNFIVENDANAVEWTAMTTAEAKTNDHAAWYIDFNPVSCYYTFRNAATNNKLILDLKAVAKVKTTDNPTEDHITDFQLNGSIEPVGLYNKKVYTYWISAAYKSSTPRVLGLSTTTGKAIYTNFKTTSTSNSQRWHIFTEAEMEDFDNAAGVYGVNCPTEETPGDIFDLSGRLVRSNASDMEGLTPGFYIVNNRKVFVK